MGSKGLGIDIRITKIVNKKDIHISKLLDLNLCYKIKLFLLFQKNNYILALIFVDEVHSETLKIYVFTSSILILNQITSH